MTNFPHQCPSRCFTPRRTILCILVASLCGLLYLHFLIPVPARFEITRQIGYSKFQSPDDKTVIPRIQLLESKQDIPKGKKDTSIIKEYETQYYNVCSHTTTFDLNQTWQVRLNTKPFSDYTARMSCMAKGHVAVFGEKFVRLSDVIVDPDKAVGEREGGEEINNLTTKQGEGTEYLITKKGFFSIPCENPPSMGVTDSKGHLLNWVKALACYNVNDKSMKTNGTSGQNDLIFQPRMAIYGTTIAIQRYEYANLFCTMTEFYNTFVMMMLTGSDPAHVSAVLIVDTHPKGALDSAWSTLYGNAIRVKHLRGQTVFSKMVWSLLSYYSPLWNVNLKSVPYLEEFRHFFLSRHGVKTDHVINCSKLNAVIIWRRDYVAHPRNPSGAVKRKFKNEAEILDQVKNTLGPDANVTAVQMDKLSMTDQVRLISTCDLLLGMHGAGLAHAMFLPSTSGFLEMFPPSVHPSTTHFTAMAKWRKLKYEQLHNKDSKSETPDKRTKIDLNLLDRHIRILRNKICPKAPRVS